MNRSFEGIQNLYPKGFDKIKNAHILVLGIGGVGSWVCESLIRSGVENITIVDMDEVCVSNINRQIHALENNIGKAKVDAMKERLLAINPSANINTIFDFYTESSSNEILSHNYDYVIDAFDSPKNKCFLISECKKRELPVIVIGGAGGRVDPTQIEVRDLNRTINDKLLARVKRILKKQYGYHRRYDKLYYIPAVFSKEMAVYNEDQNENCDLKDGSVRNCNTGFGSASFVTGAFAFAAVSFVLNEISKQE